MELVRCLDTLTPSYFKSSDDGWLEKRSERIAHRRHPARLFFQKREREKWLAVVNKVGEWLGKRRVVQKPAQSERGDKTWDSPSLPEKKTKKTMMPHTPSFWRQISFLFFFFRFLFYLIFISFRFLFTSPSFSLSPVVAFISSYSRSSVSTVHYLFMKNKGKMDCIASKKLWKKKRFREFRPGFSFFPCVFLSLNKYGTEAIDRLARLESS
jgi:hypothetical protein